ncbi:D-alanine aminotransferase [uncultured Pleomorphomonas sp.]|uniref:Probable branched-chain-amino-acid aminotransferase n=2 Tax=Pleomorphomonas TaxID=261933 RepID=A0A2G9WWL1_9HYPH|nr:D-amino-acid transaminase [Pleomorphomonas carboxyditropha]PIO99069.1 D-amino acid aminotransferase [Pleomorphomonas carboxyditropha]SCM70592.1 D-alanine aminotransferase [uncultured Pleomorphomonas sp.]
MTSRITYVNGRYVPSREAVVSVEDRGNQFADAVYEACQIKDGAIIDLRRHLDRLDRSLAELRIAAPMSRAAMTHVLREVARRNRVENGYVYWQISRGAAPRDHAFPAGVDPTFTATAKSQDIAAAALRYEKGVPVITLPDNRWERVDIKTVGLLPNALAKQAAREAGAFEAVFVDAGGFVTEGSSANVWLVDGEGRIVTRPADRGILRGITRSVLMEVAAAEGVPVVERRFTVAEMKAAREVFLTSAGATLCPVVSVDGETVANGAPGSVAARLRRRFHDIAERTPI